MSLDLSYGRQFGPDDLDHADRAAVRPAEKPPQPERGRRDFVIEAQSGEKEDEAEKQDEAGPPHLLISCWF